MKHNLISYSTCTITLTTFCAITKRSTTTCFHGKRQCENINNKLSINAAVIQCIALYVYKTVHSWNLSFQCTIHNWHTFGRVQSDGI